MYIEECFHCLLYIYKYIVYWFLTGAGSNSFVRTNTMTEEEVFPDFLVLADDAKMSQYIIWRCRRVALQINACYAG